LHVLPFGAGAGYVSPYVIYRLSVPLRTAGRYLQTHLAAGLVGGELSWSGPIGGPANVLSVTSALQKPPAGIAQVQLYETVVPGPGRSSLLLAQTLVTWYPTRSVAEFLIAARFRLMRITTLPAQGSRVTTDSRKFIAAVADAVDRLPAVPGGLRHSCPPQISIYRLVLVPAVRSQPAVVIDANNCQADAVTVGGRAQPALQDIGNSVYRLTAAFGRTSHH
jgi:hypothetical protein